MYHVWPTPSWIVRRKKYNTSSLFYLRFTRWDSRKNIQTGFRVHVYSAAQTPNKPVWNAQVSTGECRKKWLDTHRSGAHTHIHTTGSCHTAWLRMEVYSVFLARSINYQSISPVDWHHCIVSTSTTEPINGGKSYCRSRGLELLLRHTAHIWHWQHWLHATYCRIYISIILCNKSQ